MVIIPASRTGSASTTRSQKRGQIAAFAKGAAAARARAAIASSSPASADAAARTVRSTPSTSPCR